MPAGNAVSRADSILDVYGEASYSVISNIWVQLHTADPQAAGTNAAIGDRQEVTFAAASGGSKAKDNTPTWEGWDDGSVTLTHISLWTASSGGTFLESFQATAPVGVEDGNDVTLNTLTLSIAPLAS